MKLILVALLAGVFSSSAFAQDRDHEVSVGAGIGIVHAAPWANEKLRNSVNFLGTRGGAWVRYHMAYPEGSWELSTDRLDFAGSHLAATTGILSLFWRFLPEHKLHPVFAFGGGIAFTQNNFSAGNRQLAVYRLRGGVEYELQPRIDVAAYLDHFSIFRNSSGDPDIHALSPSIAIIYYFSDPKPKAAPVVVAPAPVAVPAPVAAPAVISAPAKVKPKAKSRAKAKAKAKTNNQ